MFHIFLLEVWLQLYKDKHILKMSIIRWVFGLLITHNSLLDNSVNIFKT